MAKDTARKWRNRRIICVLASRRAAANAAVAGFRWGPDFFSVPLYNPASTVVKEYAADVVLTNAMLAQLATLPASILLPVDIETPTTKAKGKARLREIATKRNVDL